MYGHSHVEHVCTVGGVLCANPGSATLPHNMNAELVSRTNIPELRCFCVAVKASGMFVRAGDDRLPGDRGGRGERDDLAADGGGGGGVRLAQVEQEAKVAQ